MGIDNEANLQHQCITTVASQNRTHIWGLTPQQEQAYAAELVNHMPEPCPPTLLAQMVVYYHLDHETVTALLHADSPEGVVAWQRCRAELPDILRYARLTWNVDSATDEDDLCQIGAEAILRALPQFHYQSRLATWMFQVFRRSVLRTLRDRKAGKRYGPTDSYDEQPTLELAADESESLESTHQFKALIALIDEILAQQQDQRLRRIFYLWAIHDLRLAEIGQITGLSQSRISILLETIRKLLSQHPLLRKWYRTMRDESDSDD